MKCLKKINEVVNRSVPFILISLLILPLCSRTLSAQELPYQREVLILPHVESNEDFFTGLSLLNTGDIRSDVRLVAYNRSSQKISENNDISLQPGARYLNSIADVFGYETATEVSWIKVEYNGDLKGFGLLGNDNQLARIPLQEKGKETILLPYVMSGDGLFTQVYILNVGAEITNLTLTAYDREGNELKKITHDLPLAPRQKFIDSVSNLFGDVSQDVSWIKIESDGSLIGLGLIGSTDRLFSIPME